MAVIDLARPLSPAGQQMLDSLPYYYQTDPTATATVDVIGRELDRIEDFLDTVRLQLFPQNADDTYGILGIWESMLGLPVEPPQLDLASRVAKVIAKIRTRRVAAGSDWVGAVDEFLGSSAWTYQENTPGAYQLQVLIPHDASGGYIIALAANFLRSITPAHIDVTVGFISTGFIVDVSHSDEDIVE